VGGVLALFAVGYAAMSQRITNAGAFFAYVAAGFGRRAGVAAGLARDPHRTVPRAVLDQVGA